VVGWHSDSSDRRTLSVRILLKLIPNELNVWAANWFLLLKNWSLRQSRCGSTGIFRGLGQGHTLEHQPTELSCLPDKDVSVTLAMHSRGALVIAMIVYQFIRCLDH
jgi:predicted ABC-type transport system involved in lysophospholipase L1 biosynthesis ATPase subunit